MNLIANLLSVTMASLNISLDDTGDTDIDKQITTQRRSSTACTISLGLYSGPGGACPSMHIPVRPKQSACAGGCSERVLHSEGTDGGLLSQQIQHSPFLLYVHRETNMRGTL